MPSSTRLRDSTIGATRLTFGSTAPGKTLPRAGNRLQGLVAYFGNIELARPLQHFPCKMSGQQHMRTFRSKFVRKLTQASRIVGIASCFSLAWPAAFAAAPEWQPVSDIAAAAENYLRQQVGPTARRTAVRAGPLDVRLKLARCDQPLQAFLRRGARVSARTIVGVRCSGSRPWKVYVPVDVIVTAKVFVANRTLPRGHLLTPEDLRAEERDVTRMVSGYITEPARVVGQRLKTQLLSGRVITPSMLAADKIVTRGQTVTLVVNNGGVAIRMTGKALSDGALNQRIRVENLNSGRIVEGIVRSRENVEILIVTSSPFFPADSKVSPKVADTRSSQQ